MRNKIIALAEKYRVLFEERKGGAASFVLETAPNIDARRLDAVRAILLPFPDEDTVLVSLFPTEFRRGAYTDDLVPVERFFSGLDNDESEERPGALFDDVDALYTVEGFYLTNNGLGLYSYGALASPYSGYIPYAQIKGYVCGNGECFAYARRREPNEESGAEVVETVTAGLEDCPSFLEQHRAFFQEFFALLQREGKICPHA